MQRKDGTYWFDNILGKDWGKPLFKIAVNDRGKGMSMPRFEVFSFDFTVLESLEEVANQINKSWSAVRVNDFVLVAYGHDDFLFWLVYNNITEERWKRL